MRFLPINGVTTGEGFDKQFIYEKMSEIEFKAEIDVKIEPDPDEGDLEAPGDVIDCENDQTVAEPANTSQVTVKEEVQERDGGQMHVVVKCEEVCEDNQDSDDVAIVYDKEPSLPIQRPFRKTCKKCKKSFRKRHRYAQHKCGIKKKKKKEEGKFQCDKCKIIFSTKSAIEIHVSRNKCLGLECKYCKKQFSFKGRLEEHERVHTGVKPFKCQYCDKSFPRRFNRDNHERLHEGIKRFPCDQCGKQFVTKKHFKSHKCQQKTITLYQCDQCDKMYSAKYELKLHSYTHSGIIPYKCESCGAGFKMKSKLKKHICKAQPTKSRTVTPKKGVLQCEYCPQEYYDEILYKEHLFKHRYKNFICDICKKEFKTKQGMVHHLFAHFGVKRYKCNFCLREFSHRYAYTEHVKQHEGAIFQCDYCNRKFSIKRTLINHIRTHTGVRPYNCTFCDKTFTIYSTYAQHEKIHMGLKKKLTCNECGKTFTTRVGIIMHMYKHFNTHPFECKLCNRRFGARLIYYKHFKKCLRPKDLPPKSPVNLSKEQKKKNKLKK